MLDVERVLLTDMYERYNYRCFVYQGRRATQRAHAIGNTKANRKRYGNAVIDSPLNWFPVSDLAANALVDVGHASNLPDEIAALIRRGCRSEIERLIRENIERKLSK